MKKTTSVFQLIILGFLYFRSVHGVLSLDPERFFLEMPGHRTYEGELGKLISTRLIPKWMGTGGKGNKYEHPVFIQMTPDPSVHQHTGLYDVALQVSQKAPKYVGHVAPGTKSPLLAELRFGTNIPKQYYKAGTFEVYVPDPEGKIWPPMNHVFIQIEDGTIYTAPLHHDPESDSTIDDRENDQIKIEHQLGKRLRLS